MLEHRKERNCLLSKIKINLHMRIWIRWCKTKDTGVLVFCILAFLREAIRNARFRSIYIDNLSLPITARRRCVQVRMCDSDAMFGSDEVSRHMYVLSWLCFKIPCLVLAQTRRKRLYPGVRLCAKHRTIVLPNYKHYHRVVPLHDYTFCPPAALAPVELQFNQSAVWLS